MHHGSVIPEDDIACGPLVDVHVLRPSGVRQQIPQEFVRLVGVETIDSLQAQLAEKQRLPPMVDNYKRMPNIGITGAQCLDLDRVVLHSK